MQLITINSKVAISGTPYTGTVMTKVGNDLVVELDGQHDELPTDACWLSDDGYILWPCLADELEVAVA